MVASAKSDPKLLKDANRKGPDSAGAFEFCDKFFLPSRRAIRAWMGQRPALEVGNHVGHIETVEAA